MTRFIAWFRFEWRDHWKLVVASALATVFVAWLALLIGGRSVGPHELQGVLVGTLALVGVVLAAGLYSAERRHGAESLVLRTPGARTPLFLARLAFVVTALGSVAIVGAFGAARLGEWVHGGRLASLLESPRLFLWPDWIVADLFVLSLAVVGVTMVMSAWTRRVPLAFFLGVIVPAILVFPWIYLGAERGDFYPFWRYGAVPLAAWPLLVLAVIALGFSWFLGRRRMNRQGRAVLWGSLVFVLGVGLAGVWTAHAFASFDEVHPQHAGFRLERYVIERGFARRRYNPALPLDSTALSSDGKRLWVQGFRVDAGYWPDTYAREGSDGRVRDFREDRGTYSRQWHIDLETGDAAPVGEVEDRIGWMDLGSGDFHGLLSGVLPAAQLSPRDHALFGDVGHGNEARVIDLATGAIISEPMGTLSREARAAAVAPIARAASPVRDAQGRPTWIETHLPRAPDGSLAEGVPDVFLCKPGIRRAVDHALVKAVTYGRAWKPVRDGFVYNRGGVVSSITITTEGKVRRATGEQAQAVKGYGRMLFLDTRYALLVDPAPPRRDLVGYVLLDLETGAVTRDLRGPEYRYVGFLAPTPDGKLLCLAPTDWGRPEDEAAMRQLVLWDPRTGTRQVLEVDGASSTLHHGSYLTVAASDGRGNLVLHVGTPRIKGLRAPGMVTMRTLYFRAATSTVHTLAVLEAGPEGTRPPLGAQVVMSPTFHAVGIDAQDRVVGLTERDGGLRKVVRYDPKDGSRTVLFPKAERGPLK